MTILKRGVVTRAAGGPARRLRLPSAAAFWLVAGAWFLLLFAAAAPSPLYGVYQAQWRFSPITLTAVFGVYALGLLVALLVFGSVSDYLGRRRVISVAMLAGCLALLAGAVMSLAAIETASAAAFLAGTAVAGAGLGIGFVLGAYRILTRLAEPGQRASLIAAIWIVFFLAFSVPVVIAGVTTTHVGLHQTAVVYSGALAVLAAAAALSFMFHRRAVA
jgi:MFS family permease